MGKAKTPTEIASLARAYTDTVLKMLAGIVMREDAPAPSRIAAGVALLDRGWGKPTQPLAGDLDNPLRVRISEIVRTIVDPNPFALVDAKAVDADESRLLPPADAGTDSDQD